MRVLVIALSSFLLVSAVWAPESHAFGRIFHHKNPKPRPMPTPTPRPTIPAPNPRSDLSPSCRRIAEGSGTGQSGCAATSIRFLNHLLAARSGVPQSLFRGDGAPHDVNEYADALINFLDQHYGLCAFWDGQSLMVRDGQNSNESWRIVGPNLVADFFYTTTCAPARKFPVRDTDLDPYNPDPLCALARMNVDQTATCGPDSPASSLYTKQVNSALDEIIAEQRANPSFLTMADGTPNPVLINKDQGQAWLARVVEKLRARGFCSYQDGGQGVTLKSTNSEDEFWALVVLGTEDELGRHPIRRKFGGACAPSDF